MTLPVPFTWPPPLPPTPASALGITSDDVSNLSTAAGATVTDALDALVGIVTPVQFRVCLTTATNSPNNTFAKVPLDTVTWDTIPGGWNAGTLRYTPQRSGYYLVQGRARTNTTGGAIGNIIAVAIAKNGTLWSGMGGDSPSFAAGGSAIIPMDGVADYFELFAFTGSIRAYTTTSFDTWLGICGPLGL